ncbi:MAG: very short patch repair endonuclease [Pseudomonadota bacterium]
MKISAARRRTMQAVKSKNTKPEIAVRLMTHAMGFRYRLHRKDLPGKPDLVFASRRKIIFVHGCFWHGHNCRRGARTPKTNRLYWQDKIVRNKARDGKARRALSNLGWQVLTIWECKLAKPESVQKKIARFLDRPPTSP